MKQLLLLLLLPCLLHAQTQQGYYSDYLRNNNGTAMYNIAVQNRTTLKTTYTDKEGFFQIKAKLGDIIRIYINYNAPKDITMEKGMLYASLPKQHAPVPLSIEPIVSNDYKDFLKREIKNNRTATMDSIIDSETQYLKVKGGYYDYNQVQQVKTMNGKLKLIPIYPKRLTFGGNYSSTIEVKTVNQLPALQSSYAQGSTKNGMIVYQGPETNELFSYGPSIQSLEYDGSTYPYDVNGKLVESGAGNGMPAKLYNNRIFRTASSFAQSITVQANLFLSPKSTWNFSLKLGNKKENTFIKHNRNSNQNMTACIGTNIGWLNISATYNHYADRFSNSNRNGFLNRAYQQASITPISFDNSQSHIIGTNQRSFSNLADNPYFLLMDNGNAYHQSQDITGLSFQKKRGRFLFKVDQSLEQAKQQSNEMYKAGTAYIPNGIATERTQSNRNYFLKANASRSIDGYHFRSTVQANYIFNTARTSINYAEGSNYNYQRSSHDMSVGYQASYQQNDISAGMGLSNKLYFSNTSSTSTLLLPAANAYIRIDELFGLSKLNGKIYTAFTSSKNEPSISNSLSYLNLLQYSAQQSMQYFPMTEVEGYDNLKPIHQNEFRLGLEINYHPNFTLTAEYFNKQINDDVFPMYSNGKLFLQNIASHRTNGVELQLTYTGRPEYRNRQFSNSHSISFFAYQSKVTDVGDGFNYTPIAGFSNVHKAIIKGQPLGVIVGNSFLRNADNKILIGADGFPLVNNQPTVLGNAIPDFVIKLNNGFSYKKLTLNLDWEWSKGGDRWNGTQAALDYYGRSQTSADLRNTNNYVFDGITQNGQHNSIPVSFYDASLPTSQNRWSRYGIAGVAEEYMQKADCIRLRVVSLSYNWQFKKYIQSIKLGAFINNIVVWTAYKGADPNQLLFDQSNSSGFDYFNLPSTKNIGLSLSIQF
jgi:hypothetical protein